MKLLNRKKNYVIFIQKTHSDVKNAADWMQEWEGITVLSQNTTTLSGGVGVLFAKSFCPVCHQVEEIVKGRLLKIRVVVENYVFVFICVYAPTSAVE